jgi:hypothetical protein
VPATHGLHVPPLVPVYPTLHAQLVRAVLPAAELESPGQLKQVVKSTARAVVEYWLTRQLMQVLDRVAPIVPEYLPAPQSVHAALPVIDLKVPATQGRHGPLLAPVYPTLHAQAVLPAVELEFPGQLKHVLSTEAFVVVEYLPWLQSVQDWLPCVALYLPASHAIHVPPSGPVYPTTHRQLVTTILPLREIEFSGQAAHVFSRDAPTVSAVEL